MRVPENMLGCFIIVFSLVGAYALRNDMADVWYMAVFGIMGYFMRRYALPVPPLILGLILGPLAERYFITSMISSNNDLTVFFARPVSGALMAVSAAFLLMPLIRSYRSRRRMRKAQETQ
jgi:putative tricarboxylic transport membrane protein